MSDHDPQCRYEEDDGGPLEWCDCALIAKVRADEREQEHIVSLLISQKLRWEADLRAKVSALPHSGIEIPYAKGVEHEYEMVRRADVLRLIDGGSDGGRVYQTELGWVTADAAGWTDKIYPTEAEARAGAHAMSDAPRTHAEHLRSAIITANDAEDHADEVSALRLALVYAMTRWPEVTGSRDGD